MVGRTTRAILVLASVIGLLGVASTASAARRDFNAGAAYTLTNNASGNAVVVFGRAQDGTLAQETSVATGGFGTGAGLGSQGGLVLAGDTLYAVNAGDSTISQLHIGGPAALQLVGAPVASNGTDPISIAVQGPYLYVLNAGGTPNVTGFTTNGNRLTPIAGSTRSLGPGAATPEQISFTPDGHSLIVSEKGSNTIDVFQVGQNGRLSLGAANASIGGGPYGFGFDNHQDLIISEAGSASVSSYAIGNGGLFPLSQSVSTNGQSAPCWLVVTNDGKFAFTANAGSNSISSFSTENGAVSLIGSTSLGAGTTHPLDEAVTNDGHDLYTVDTNPVTGARQITALAVGHSGALTLLGSFGTLPAGATGLVVR